MRVAFTMFADADWTGGLNYLRNLFSALAALPGRPLEPVLFVPQDMQPEAYAALVPYLPSAPVTVALWRGRRRQALSSTLFGVTDRVSLAAFRAQAIDLVFVNDSWYGRRFPIPTLAWIADFQHCHLPHMFSALQRLKRRMKYSAYAGSAAALMVSSEDGRRDCETFFPQTRGKVHPVPFAVLVDESFSAGDPLAVAARHRLPSKYFYFPAQMWRHKNHLNLVRALLALKDSGTDVVIVATGNAKDVFRPEYPGQVLAEAAALGDTFRFLGLVPYKDIMPLMRGSAAVLNASQFEGWSTTVEEAKALGVPLVLSNLRVHREQAPSGTWFFDEHSVEDMAAVLKQAWEALPPGPRPTQEKAALQEYEQRRYEFASRFRTLSALAVEIGRNG